MCGVHMCVSMHVKFAVCMCVMWMCVCVHSEITVSQYFDTGSCS